jgi:monothiol glutaredoxin
MSRKTLDPSRLSPEAATAISSYHSTTIDTVAKAIESNRVVVVGMSLNPFVKKAKAALSNAKVDFKYLEFGSYTSMWKERLAIKIWSGWPTYPQVFVDGKLVGGFQETKKALEEGKIK